MSRKVVHDGEASLQIRFAFDRRLVDLVKTLPNRRWQASERFWWTPDDDVVAVVDLLEPHGFDFDEATCELYRSLGGALPLEPSNGAPAGAPAAPQSGMRGLFDEPAARQANPGDFSVSRLNERVREALAEAFPAPIWLVGEISGFNKSSHKRVVSFQLDERDESGRSVSEVGAVLFPDTRLEIEAALAAAGNPFRLEDEITVRVRARVDLYVAWGSYRVVIEELDVHYTLGEAARRREEIVRRLTAAGLTERNTALPFPPLPLRVGLVTSLDSDAYNDVLRTLQESGYAFRVTAHGARVQGRSTEPSVLNALDWFRERAADFDVLLICRGGGSRTDLAWLDTEPLGRAVATFPLPVVVGIGHEQDRSVLDAVGRRCKTPTAAARLLVDTVRDSLFRLESTTRAILGLAERRIADARQAGSDAAARLVRAAMHRIERERGELRHHRLRVVRGATLRLASAGRELRRRAAAVPRAAGGRIVRARAVLDAGSRQLLQGARRDLEAARRRIDELRAALGPAGRRRLAREQERSEARGRRLALADPRRVVERGYAILRGTTGGVLTDPRDAPRGAAVTAELRGGKLKLVSEGKDAE